MKFTSKQERDFWERVYIEVMNFSQSPAAIADTALDARRSRMPEPRSSMAAGSEPPLTRDEQVFARSGLRLDAIKAYRKRTGMSLADSRKAVWTFLGLPT